jgi:hypothetical protein
MHKFLTLQLTPIKEGRSSWCKAQARQGAAQRIQIKIFVAHYNHPRCHESFNIRVPGDVYFDREKVALLEGEKVKRLTIGHPRLRCCNNVA